MNFNEDFLHFVWKFRLFNQQNLITTSGEVIEIASPGIHNSHAGPDFENASIFISDTLWAGSVEIHLRSSDWEKHRHEGDSAYNNVILHVVYQHDASAYRSDGTEIPVLELKERIANKVAERYQGLMQNLSWIPCEKQIAGVEEIHVQNWLTRLLMERLEAKSAEVLSMLSEYQGNWDNTFYVILAKNFGFKLNALPFEMLAKSLSQQVLAKHKNSRLQIEALIFGQAGFLNDAPDEYAGHLQAEFLFLQKKYSLSPIPVHTWKFLRLRPQNFPTLRLGQFAALVFKSNHLFSKIIEVKEPKQLAELFRDLPVNDYWKNHYRFGVPAPKVSTTLGEGSINNILINSVALTLFSYGKFAGRQDMIARAIRLLENAPFETNHVTKGFIDLGLKPGNADRSQALLQLKKSYCDIKKCLSCAIGAKIVNAG